MHESEGFSAVAAFVRAALPPPPAPVLEVGAGSGELASLLAGVGYDVTAIDPASTSANVQPVGLQDLDAPSASLDAAVAVVSMHHIEPLEPSCRRLGELVRPGGVLIIDEFDVERFDERAAAWQIEHAADPGRHGRRDPVEFVTDMRHHLHSLERIVDALQEGFDIGNPVRGPYLYRWYVAPGLRDAEERLIASGDLPATGARLVCTRR